MITLALLSLARALGRQHDYPGSVIVQLVQMFLTSKASSDHSGRPRNTVSDHAVEATQSLRNQCAYSS